MPIEVISPVTRKGSKVSGNIPGDSPGAMSNPSRRGRSDAGSQMPDKPLPPVSQNSEKPAPLPKG
jgi:hypothetical protein